MKIVLFTENIKTFILNDEVIKGEFWQSSIKSWVFPGAAQFSENKFRSLCTFKLKS